MSQHRLSEADARALDRLVEAGFEHRPGSAPEEERRAAAVHALLRSLEHYPTQAPSDVLVDATMARIAQAEDARAGRMKFAQEGAPAGRRTFSIGGMVAVAACLLLAVGTILPVTHAVRAGSARSLCASALGGLGRGLHSFGSDHDGLVPMTAGFGLPAAGATTGEALRAKSDRFAGAALGQLAHGGYCTPECLHCAGAGTFAYRVPLHAAHMRLLLMPRAPVAADRNPELTLPSGMRLDPEMRGSENHARVGLNALFADGSTTWFTSPVVEVRVGARVRPDDLWLPRLTDGTEGFGAAPISGSAYDIFLSN